MRNVLHKSCTENQSTHLIFNNFFSEDPSIYKITQINILQPYRPQMTVWPMRFAYWIPRATNTCLE